MKLRSQRSSILPVAQRAARVAGGRSAIPILSGALIRAGEGLVIAATDATSGYHATVAAAVDAKGACVVNAKSFADAIDTMPDGEVTIALDGITLKISGGKRRVSLPTQHADEYPTLAPMPKAWTTLDAKAFGRLLDHAAFARSNEGRDSKGPPFTGTSLDVKDGKLRACATNGHRLAVATIAAEAPPTFRVLLPGAFIAHVESLAGTVDSLRIATEGGNVFATFGDETVWSALYTSEFPDVDSVLKLVGTPLTTVSIDRAKLAASLAAMTKMVGVVDVAAKGEARGSLRSCTITVDAKAGTMAFESAQDGRGDVADTLDCDVNGDSAVVGLAIHYVLDAANAYDSERVLMTFAGSLEPASIQPEDANADAKCVVMPVRL